MNILIVSDTHRRNENLRKVLEKSGPLDMLIHLGDGEGSDELIASWVNPGCLTEFVLGNNDFFSNLDREKDIMIGNYRALLTHGHYYSVSLGPERLIKEARAAGYDIAMFGHTHRQFLEVKRKEGEKDLIVLNPGSLSYPRQEGHKPSYIRMELDSEGTAHFAVNYLD